MEDKFYLNNCGEDDVLSFDSAMFKVDKLREEVNGLDEQFKLLNSNEVVTVDRYYQVVISHSTFRVAEFTEALMQDLRSFVTANYARKQEQELQKGWFEEGTDCEILRLGAKNWQKGKVKIRVSLEFCPNELGLFRVSGVKCIS